MRNIKKLSQRQESKSASVLKTITTPSSGNTWYSKGDSQSRYILVENKFTFKKSYSVKLDDLQKVEKQAGIKMPVFEIQFKPSDETYVILKRDDFIEMRKTYEENSN